MLFIDHPNVKYRGVSTDFSPTIMLLRCTEKKYAKSFVEKGTIRFGTPNEWRKIKKEGQGDRLEGCYSSVTNIDGAEPFLLSLRDNSFYEYIEELNKYCFFDNEILKQRSFCLYGLNKSLFSQVHTDNFLNKIKIGIIPHSYFQDFTNVTQEEYESLDDDDKPVVLFINNPKEFFKRVRDSLHSIGIYDKEIIIRPVNYVDRSENWVLGEPSPKELFFKELKFKQQGEIRIVINTKRQDIIEMFNNQNGLIDIGNLSDICFISDYYFKDLNVSLGDKELFYELDKPITSKVTFDEALAILVQYLCDEAPESPLSIDALNDKLKEFSLLFDKSFNCDYNPNHLYLYNRDNNQTYEFSKIVESRLIKHSQHYYEKNNYQEFYKANKLITLYIPTASYAWWNIGVYYFSQKNYQLMFENFDKAIELDPNNKKYKLEYSNMIKHYK